MEPLATTLPPAPTPAGRPFSAGDVIGRSFSVWFRNFVPFSIVTGALLMWGEHIGQPRFGIAAGIALALVRLGLLAGMRRTWRGLLARIQGGESVPADDPSARRMGMLSGIAHTMWLLALAGMIFPI